DRFDPAFLERYLCEITVFILVELFGHGIKSICEVAKFILLFKADPFTVILINNSADTFRECLHWSTDHRREIYSESKSDQCQDRKSDHQPVAGRFCGGLRGLVFMKDGLLIQFVNTLDMTSDRFA